MTFGVRAGPFDQPTAQMLRDGSLEGLHLTGSFGSRAAARLATLREHQPTGPLMCAEFWDGWFDWWGGHHHTTSVADAAGELDTLLSSGASVNFYMFHGGTNFGLTNGANDKGRYHPILTSYDYDAPLDEAGNPTDKYFAFRDVIARHESAPDSVPMAASDAPVLTIDLARVPWSAPTQTTSHRTPPTFEELGHLSALVRYETDLPEGGDHRVLTFDEVRDRAWVSVDGSPVGTMSRTMHERSIALPPGRRLSVLVEDQGRVNYGERIGEHKGLIGAPRLDGVALEYWTAAPIDVSALGLALSTGDDPDGESGPVAGPVALRGRFSLEEPADRFLDTGEW